MSQCKQMVCKLIRVSELLHNKKVVFIERIYKKSNCGSCHLCKVNYVVSSITMYNM